MRNVLDHELSALLDGELDTPRARDVLAQMRTDPALREEYEALAALDARLADAAAEACFSPEITFPSAAARRPKVALAVLGVLCLVVIRVLPKLVELSLLGLAFQLAAFAAIAIAVVRMARETPAPGALSC